MKRRHPFALGELPEDYERQGRVLDPSSAAAIDWINRYKTTDFFRLIGTASVNLLMNNQLRTYLLIQNLDPVNDLFVSYGKDAVLNQSERITAGNILEYTGGAPSGSHVPSDSINIIASGAATPIVVVEGTLMPYELATR